MVKCIIIRDHFIAGDVGRTEPVHRTRGHVAHHEDGAAHAALLPSAAGLLLGHVNKLSRLGTKVGNKIKVIQNMSQQT